MLRGLITYVIFLFKKDRLYYYKLIRFLGFLPVRVSLYRIAFTHKSASFKLKDGTVMNNERLEYLGDALLGAIAAEFIYTVFDHMDEGYMTKLRSRIVKRKNLNAMAIEMGIPELVSSHAQSVNSAKHLYGNALEALIGAIYLDKGYRCASKFFRKRMIYRHVDLASLAKKDSDYKSQLIEWAQKSKREVLFFSREQYDTVSRAPSFEATVQIDMKKCGTGIAASKKEAEQQAAREALKGIPV